MPRYGVPKKRKAGFVQFSFKFRGDFATKGGCLCRCCEFRQELITNEVTLDCPISARAYNRPRPHHDVGEGGEDCTWIFGYTYDGGRKFLAGAEYYRTGPPDKPPDPWPHPPYPHSRLKKGPICPGHRIKPASPPGVLQDDSPTGYGPNDAGIEGCVFNGQDSPGIWVPAKCAWEWHFVTRGYILSKCPSGQLEEAFVDVTLGGVVDADGDGVIEDRTVK